MSASTNVFGIQQKDMPDYDNTSFCSAKGLELNTFISREWMWSPLDTNALGVPKSRQQPVADGGVYDDNGHLPLLRRGVKQIVFFDNWLHQDDLDAEMMYTKAAFGMPSGPNNSHPPGSISPRMQQDFLTVFDKKEFPALWEKMLSFRNASKPCVVRGNFTVVDNVHFGIKGGWQVEIIFVAAWPLSAFIEGLPAKTAAHVPPHFPQVDQDYAKSHFHLSMLSQYSSYLADAAISEIMAMLGDVNPEPVMV